MRADPCSIAIASCQSIGETEGVAVHGRSYSRQYEYFNVSRSLTNTLMGMKPFPRTNADHLDNLYMKTCLNLKTPRPDIFYVVEDKIIKLALPYWGRRIKEVVAPKRAAYAWRLTCLPKHALTAKKTRWSVTLTAISTRAYYLRPYTRHKDRRAL